MTVPDTRTASISAGFGLNFQWGPIIAGAIAAAALAFVLDSLSVWLSARLLPRGEIRLLRLCCFLAYTWFWWRSQRTGSVDTLLAACGRRLTWAKPLSF